MFPRLGSIRCLLSNPRSHQSRWQQGFAGLLAALQRQVAELDAVLDRGEHHPSSSPRLRHQREALQRQHTALGTLLAAHDLAPSSSAGSPPSTSTRPFNPQSGYVQMMRDWAWESAQPDENAAAMEEIAEVHDAPLGHMLVLGAGAGRLTLDLYRRGASSAVALDVNPLPLAVFSTLLAGDEVRLAEFPAAAVADDEPAQLHRLRLSEPVPECVAVLCDAHAVAWPTGAFDTVVTPWFLDQCGADAVQMMSTVHRLLRPGGTWINHGPLLYSAAVGWPARYGSAELCAWADGLGFDVGPMRSTSMQYLGSPHSTQRKQERIFTWAAVRRPAPAWLDDDTAAIPAGGGGDETRDPIGRWCASQVDGHRCLGDLARSIGEQTRMPYARALEGVRGRLHRHLARV